MSATSGSAMSHSDTSNEYVCQLEDIRMFRCGMRYDAKVFQYRARQDIKKSHAFAVECVNVNDVMTIGRTCSRALAQDVSSALNKFLQSQRLNGSPSPPNNDSFFDDLVSPSSTKVNVDTELISTIAKGFNAEGKFKAEGISPVRLDQATLTGRVRMGSCFILCFSDMSFRKIRSDH